MDTVLCDELLQEIFHRLAPPSSSAVSLVSKRWCSSLRHSTTSLSLNLNNNTDTNTNSVTSFLSTFPFLSSLSIACDDFSGDQLLLIISATCLNLKQLRFLSSPVSPFCLSTLSSSCVKLDSVSVTVSRPLCFTWLIGFKCLKTLTLYFENYETRNENGNFGSKGIDKDCSFDVELGLESLCLKGIMECDYEIGCVWKNCKNVKKLVLKSCESLGDYYSFFSGFMSGIHEVELRSCRNVVDGVLLKLAENSVSLSSLLIYDGGNREGLLHFIKYCKCELKRFDLRLPLDLDNSHLIALCENLNFRGLTSLMLQSCCLVSGEGLKAIAGAMGENLEELALINCDVVERESGLLTSLGQGLKRLRKLDLSYNDMLLDKELVSMLVSCDCLEELKLRGCNKLSNVASGSMVRSCKMLRSLDIKYCRGIDIKGVEFLVMNSARLEHLEVEQGKLSGVSRKRALSKCIEVVS